jgi:hypothetical protein
MRWINKVLRGVGMGRTAEKKDLLGAALRGGEITALSGDLAVRYD